MFLLATCLEALGKALMASGYGQFIEAAVEQIHRYLRLEQIHPYWGNLVLIKGLESLARLHQQYPELVSAIDSYWRSPHLGHAPAIRLAAMTTEEFVAQLPTMTPLSALCQQGLRRFLSTPFADLDCLYACWQSLRDPLLQAQMLRVMASWLPVAESDRKKPAAVEQPSGQLQLRLTLPPKKQHELSSGGEDGGQQPGEQADWHAELAADVGKLQIAALKLRMVKPPTAPSTDQEKLGQLLQVLWDNYDSYAFRYPVDPSVPNYYQVITEPMDLNTLKQRSHASLTALLLDLRKIFANCLIFNQPDSLICDQARRLKKVAIKEAKRLFPGDKQLIKSLLAIDDAAVVRAAPEPSSMTSAMPAPAPAPMVQQQKSDRELMAMILDRLLSHKNAYWFNAPIDPDALGIPHYRDIIKEPMDLGTIHTRLHAEHYTISDTEMNHAQFHYDVSLVFGNCRQFNHPNTLVYIHGVEMEKLWERLWRQHFKHLDNIPVKIQPCESILITIIEQVMQHPWATCFLAPVDTRLYPTYRKIVKQPIDLGTIKDRLLKHQYRTAEAVKVDMELMVANCERFNGAGTDIVKAAEALLEMFLNLYEEMGL